MDDLLQNQINKNCKLALPEGLKDLMSDISREVLRAQPRNLYKFIADYLAALLVTREHLSIASRVCSDVCDNIVHPSLDDELNEIGLKDEELEQVKEIVTTYFESGKVQEDKLLLKLLRKTNIEEYYLPAIQDAIKNAYLRYKLSVPPPTLTESDGIDVTDDVTRAVKHTLMVYEKTAPSEEQLNQMSTKIQAAYRGYGVRRQKSYSDEYQPVNTPTETSGKSIRFIEQKDTISIESDVTIKMHYRDFTLSTSSLAGSYVKLPYYKPYSVVNQSASDIVEENEKQKSSIDYINENKYRTDKTKSVKIGFHNLQDEGDASNNTYDESDGAVEEFNGPVEEAGGLVGEKGSVFGKSNESDGGKEYVASEHKESGELGEYVIGEPNGSIVPGSKASIVDEPENEYAEDHEYDDTIHNVTATSDRTISPESDIEYENIENNSQDLVDSDFIPEEIAVADEVPLESNDILTEELFEELGSDS